MLALLVFGYLSTSQSSPGDRLYMVLHNPYMDQARWTRELSLVKELGFGGIRLSFGIVDLLNKDMRSMSNFGRRWVDLALRKVKDSGLKLHLTMGDDLPEANPAVNMAAHRYLVRKAVEMLPPGRLTFDLQNEPKAFIHLDPAMVQALNRRAESFIGIWGELGLQAKGYVLMTPTFHGYNSDWVDGRNVPYITLAESLKRYSDRLVKAYDSSMGPWLRNLNPALNLYAPGRYIDAAEFEETMARMILQFLTKNRVPMPVAITEFGVFFGSGISDAAWSEKVASMAKVLMQMPEVRFAAYYCLSDDARYELITSKGVRNEPKIAALKRSLMKYGLAR